MIFILSSLLDPDFLYLTIKIGDKRTSLAKPDHIGMKHMMIVEALDPREWRGQVYHSAHMQRAFGLIKVPRSWKQNLKQATSSIGTIGAERERAGYIDIAELETLTGLTTLESDWKGSSVVPIVDGTMLSPSIIKDSSLKTFDKVIDWNAVSSGNHSVGSGQTYTTWVSAFADTANLTGNLTFTQKGDTTDTTRATITEDLNGFTFKMTTDTAHNGNPTASVNISNFNAANIMLMFEAEGPGVVEVAGLHCKRITSSAANAVMACFQVTTGFTWKVHDILGDQNSLGARFFRIIDVDVLAHVWNMKIWDATATLQAFLIDANAGNASSLYENITILNSGNNSFNLNNNAGTFRNCYAESVSNTAWGLNGGATGENNSSDDDSSKNSNWSSGSNNVPSTATSEFLSVSDADSDFANVKEGALSTAGSATAITENIVGMRGNTGGRTGSTPSIGADEFGEVEVDAVRCVPRSKMSMKSSLSLS